jgi:ATP phosphoribosyltransferase regulatory subunit
MLEMLAVTGLQNVHLDLGHVEIFRSLSEQAGLSKAQEAELFDALQRKARTELDELVDGFDIAENYKTIFKTLPTLNGGVDVLAKASKVLANTGDTVLKALNDLQAVADKLSIHFPSLPVSFDLSELRGYHYHTGIVFASFVPDLGREVARGGRYDNIGEFFGRARAATGFSADLKLLNSLSKQLNKEDVVQLIYAPLADDTSLTEMIRDLRAQGIAVVQQLPGHADELKELACTGVLEKQNQNWVIKSLG